MENCVVFKDGHIEPILQYNKNSSRIEVITSSGKYLYCEYIVNHPNGLYKYLEYKFYKYRGYIDYESADWIVVDNIKEFRFNE